MSLVDYAASDDDDDDEEEEIGDLPGAKVSQQRESFNPSAPLAPVASPSPSIPPPNPSNQNSVTDKSANTVVTLPPPSLGGLPDVSVLFSAPSSRVAVADAKCSSRKRESNGSTFSQPSSKYSKGELGHLRNAPNKNDGLLVPPQLSGRSNVVTEDMGKLFVRKRIEPSK